MATSLDPVERALVERHVHQWRTTGPLLQALRMQSVAALSEEEGRRAALDLAASLDRLPPRPPREGSGLVEQQRLFARLQTR